MNKLFYTFQAKFGKSKSVFGDKKCIREREKVNLKIVK